MKQHIFHLTVEVVGIILLGLTVLAIPVANLFFLYFFAASIYLIWKYDWYSIFIGSVIFQMLFLLVALLPFDHTGLTDDTNQLIYSWFIVPILVAPTMSIIWILKKAVESLNRGR